jgi:hypothetical protein
MPFASKFRAMMGFPFAGDTLEGFDVESVEVRDAPHTGSGGYVYDVRLVLCGPGGQAGVRRALKALFAHRPVTFSGYGNPYQLWFGKPAIESLGEGRYAVTVEGGGARIYLEDELARFLAYLQDTGHLAAGEGGEAAIEAYLARYQREIRLQVGRYRSRLRREAAS